MQFLTHVIEIKSDNSKKTRMTKEEANKALEEWGKFKPVPVPNVKCPDRTSRYINPRDVTEIRKRTSEESIKKLLSVGIKNGEPIYRANGVLFIGEIDNKLLK